MAADGCATDGVSAARAAAFAILDRRLDRASAAPLALGLSGGGDSLALLHLTVAWARAAGRRVLALTVDHRLHPDSARWTCEAGAAARGLGADWRALDWGGPKPATGVPAAARRARHALLADAARAAGAAVVLLGHTADDVEESELIRRETPGHGRLRAWAPSPVWPAGRGVFLLRPLLGVRRAVLREMLAAAGSAWLDDPANTDTGSARARVRALLQSPRSERERFDREEGFAPRRSGARCRLRPDATARVERSGAVVLDRTALATPCGLLAHALVCAGGRERPPSAEALSRLADTVGTGADGTATLGGARVVVRGGVVTLCRELGRRPPAPLALPPGAPVMFDGRFDILAKVEGWRVAPLSGFAARLPAPDRRRLLDIAPEVRPTLPVLVGPAGEPRLPQPFADGPGEARQRVGARLAGALGRLEDERALVQATIDDGVYGA